MLLALIQRYLREHPVANASAILDGLVFVSCDIGLPLVFRGYTEPTALELLSAHLYSRRRVREY